MKFLKSYFVACLVLAVLARFFLYSIICEMYILVRTVFNAELETGGSDVPNRIKIGRNEWIRNNQSEAANIELSPMEQKGVYIFLNNKGSVWMFLFFPLNVLLDLLCFLADLYSTTSVWVFAGLYNPKKLFFVFLGFSCLFVLFYYFEILFNSLNVES